MCLVGADLYRAHRVEVRHGDRLQAQWGGAHDGTLLASAAGPLARSDHGHGPRRTRPRVVCRWSSGLPLVMRRSSNRQGCWSYE
ncbi:hypothetical protein SSAG_03574 [Streptomyces sp. Mg1]|nr:hypothetical protein SSAG_03574 [Streptomyces sp. Mg1]